MQINGIYCNLIYPIQHDPGMALTWTEMEGGYLRVEDLGITYDKRRSSFSVEGEADEIFAIHDALRAGVKADSVFTIVTAPDEAILGSLYANGTHTAKLEAYSRPKRINLRLYQIKMDWFFISSPVRRTVTADLYSMPLPLEYENGLDMQQNNFEPIYPDTFQTLTDGAEVGSWTITTPALTSDEAAAIIKDLVVNVRRLSFEIPSAWSGLHPFGKSYAPGIWAFVRSAFESVSSFDNHTIKLELIQDVR